MDGGIYAAHSIGGHHAIGGLNVAGSETLEGLVDDLGPPTGDVRRITPIARCLVDHMLRHVQVTQMAVMYKDLNSRMLGWFGFWCSMTEKRRVLKIKRSFD